MRRCRSGNPSAFPQKFSRGGKVPPLERVVAGRIEQRLVYGPQAGSVIVRVSFKTVLDAFRTSARTVMLFPA